MIRRPRRPPPFPSPTLSRPPLITTLRSLGSPTKPPVCLERAQSRDRRRSEHDRKPYQQVSTGDRKSTRLNSSHSQISYAVLCLKKKKKNRKKILELR